MKNNKKDFKKKVFILGASSDIGISLIEIYLKNNYNIIAHYNKGNKNFFNLLKKNKNISPVKFDFSNNLKKISNFCKKRLFYNCDVFINAAAVIKENSYYKNSAKDILDSLKINLIPGILLTKNIGKKMYKKRWGRIVHLGSIGVKFGGGQKNFPYSLSKHGLEFFPSTTKSWIKNNVFINTIRVGLTKTKIHRNLPSKNLSKRISLIPMKRMAKVEEISKLVFFLGSDKNTFISHEVINISGGE